MIGRTLTAEWQRLRWQVLERDNFTCRYCGQSAPNVVLEADHVIPVADGGDDSMENLVTACRSCNQGKEYSMWARRAEQRAARTSTGRPRQENSLAGRVREMYEQDIFVTAGDIAKALGCSANTARITLRRVSQ
jgi:5-methylcytosine-specific restriction endonuclease McrA